MNVYPLKLIGELMKPIKMDTVDWGGHDPIPYPMDRCMLSEVDWGAHD